MGAYNAPQTPYLALRGRSSFPFLASQCLQRLNLDALVIRMLLTLNWPAHLLDASAAYGGE